MIKINNWSVGGNNNPYIPPECRTLHLSGIVFNHPKIADGAQVTTSAIIDAKKRIVYTTSGSIYILGKISKSYLSVFSNSN